jgi:hypothetical protein
MAGISGTAHELRGGARQPSGFNNSVRGAEADTPRRTTVILRRLRRQLQMPARFSLPGRPTNSPSVSPLRIRNRGNRGESNRRCR